MRRKAIGLFHFLRCSLGGHRQWVIIGVLAVFLIPSTAGAAGLGDILSLIKTITSTIEGAIGGALNDIQKVDTLLNHYRQEIIWPLTAIDQAKTFVVSMRSQYGHLMFGIVSIRNNSATLVPPSQLESLFRGGQYGSLGQVQPAYASVYNPVPTPTSATLTQRNMMDMDDALAVESLKTTILSDQTSQSLFTLADSIEQQSATAAPGSGPMISTQAEVAELETQALMAKVLAAELRAEAAKLAHENAWLKQSSGSVRNLENQLQQVLSKP
jgi:hypothetical protein